MKLNFAHEPCKHNYSFIEFKVSQMINFTQIIVLAYYFAVKYFSFIIKYCLVIINKLFLSGLVFKK